MDYAIFRSGGKQYRVSPGNVIDVDRLPVESGIRIELENVLAVSRDGQLTLGTPVVEGARVVAQVEAQTRDKKVIVFKFKRKVRYRRKRGHRQPYTRLAITELLLGGEEASPLEEVVVIEAAEELEVDVAGAAAVLEEDGVEPAVSELEPVEAEAEDEAEAEPVAEVAEPEPMDAEEREDEPVAETAEAPTDSAEEPGEAQQTATEESGESGTEEPPAPRTRRRRRPA